MMHVRLVRGADRVDQGKKPRLYEGKSYHLENYVSLQRRRYSTGFKVSGGVTGLLFFASTAIENCINFCSR